MITITSKKSKNTSQDNERMEMLNDIRTAAECVIWGRGSKCGIMDLNTFCAKQIEDDTKLFEIANKLLAEIDYMNRGNLARHKKRSRGVKNELRLSKNVTLC